MKGYFAFILLITLFLASSMKIKQQPETISVSSDDSYESKAGEEMEIGEEAASNAEIVENKADFHGKWGIGKKNNHQRGMKMEGNFHNKKGDRRNKMEAFFHRRGDKKIKEEFKAPKAMFAAPKAMSVSSIDAANHSQVYRFETSVPKDSLDKVKKALGDAGAGKYGPYDNCMWQTLGLGQFRPLKGSNPTIGTQGKIEQVEEYKLEMIVPVEKINDVIEALKKSHPYEVPSFQYWLVYID